MEYFRQQDFEELQSQAENGPRKRANLNIHSDLSDPIQRLFISIAPGTYVRPHRHCQVNKYELSLMVSGKATVLIFDDDGTLLERHELSAQGENKGLEIPPGTFHTFLPDTQPSTFLEVKPGPYEPVSAEEFAHWSPEEGDESVQSFIDKLYALAVGQRIVD